MSIRFKSENRLGKCPGFIQGNTKNTKKGLIVLQEWWGMNDQIKTEALEIGKWDKKDRFVTLIPDLYRGKVAKDSETAGHLMNNLDWVGAVADIRGAAQYLLDNGCTKVGVTGFCMGGALSLAAAALVKEISASAPFYGIPSGDLCDVSSISIPVQAHFGEDDHLKGFSSKEDAEILKEKQKNNPKFELFLYPGCGHAFTNQCGPLDNYKEEECELAIGRVVKFMEENLS